MVLLSLNRTRSTHHTHTARSTQHSIEPTLVAHTGITYVPDFLANRMGIVNCANEQYGYVNDDPAIHRHFGREWENSIFVKTREVLKRAEAKDISTAVAANEIADEMAAVPHPIWGHRSAQVIASLVANEWAAGGPFGTD